MGESGLVLVDGGRGGSRARRGKGGIKRDYWTILSAIYETDMFGRLVGRGLSVLSRRSQGHLYSFMAH